MLLKWRTLLLDKDGQSLNPSRHISNPEEHATSPTLGIASIGIENYKSIRELDLPIQPFMVFVGPNAAGKTNLIQALSLLLDLQADGTTEPFELYGGFDQLVTRTKRRRHFIKFRITAPLRKMATFRQAERLALSNLMLEHDLTLRAGSNAGEVRVDLESARILESGREVLASNWKNGDLKDLIAPKEWGITQEGLSKIGGEGDPHAVNLLWLLRSLRYARLLQVTRLRLDASALRRDSQLTTARHGHVLGPTGEGLPLAVERFKQQGKLPGIIAGLREVYPRIKDVDTIHPLPGQVALKFTEDGIEDGLGQANVSDGIMHALAILIALESPGPLAVEEPENALHPWALRKLMEKMRNRKSTGPLLITTHSPTVVDCITDPDDLFIVDNSVEKGTTVTRATCKEEALKIVMSESGQQLGQIWLDGSLGGVPGE